METLLDKSNYPPNVSTLGTLHRQSVKENKHFKIFSTLEQYLSSIQEIRIIDQLLKPNSKKEKQQMIKRVNAVLLELKQQLDEIQTVCKYFIGKQQLFIQAELITIIQWRSQIKKIDKLMHNIISSVNDNYARIANIYGIETKIFNVGSSEWRRKCEMNLKSSSCLCIRS